ncbi:MULTISPECIES: ABC transporter ATP-binding protein [Geobacillus]|jgi:iron complex transport system ATP-binding protein|uniref:Ferrichrome ABC transporter ATP-binding protein n=2 Tax=Geobacillus thermodenitrificans TaxID=33940 RepID=A4IMU0_GEOTN|nr:MULTISPECIES: ABC transporter ATP-binding protein [Geobacillus]ABO66644.1 Ferrichrome ABC transporter ATP-binding protein [Geobacillus thermodenitrificans NG80-2]ARA96991.1 iron ABC transporter ATP-binding protein [Geobacillus thermodenitrificans]ARP42401.1 Iron(3+)-hydroxamate import ATP-binding protein FhuC [Geobacillus thermodenitrificans]ATO36267.1 iron ABC transporter ATP-binding protein [Geobacillus thermodenitrificans]KQB93614.1 putative ABC transporter ATP-binding protein YclP [Geob
MVEVKQVSKRYGGKKVVDEVSLSIPRRQLTSLIGPNGAGKSTLLSIMSRLIPKDSGEVWIDGKEISRYRTEELAKKISILKQSNHIAARLTVKELVSFGRFPYSRGRLTRQDNEYVREAIHYMELDDLQHRYLDELSGGQRQRAYIAMVLAQDTDYIFLDEPLNNLDMKHSVQMMKVLRNLVDQLDKTIVIVMHDINFASCYSDYIVALKDGKVVSEGDVSTMMRSQVLRGIYDMDVHIQTIENRRICVYF